MMLPQRPYFPIGSLHAAIAYPGRSRQLSAPTRSAKCSTRWACRSWRRGWTRKRTGTGCSRSASSSGSGWRARCCTRRNTCSSTRRPPRSTSPRRPRSTACSTEKLPATTIVSIGHRSTLDAFHQRNVALVRDGDRFALQEAGRSRPSAVAGGSRASAAAMAGGAPSGARHRRRRSAAARRPAPARTGTTRADCRRPPAAD